MADVHSRPGRGGAGFVGGLLLGLVIGVVLAGAAGFVIAQRPAVAPDPWIPAGAPWLRLPSHALADPLPQTFAVPPVAYGYGATTRVLPPTVTAQPGILRVDLSDVSGTVGVSTARPDGSALVSTEQAVTAMEGKKSVYFWVTAAQGPIAVLLRNYAAQGGPGGATVQAVVYAPLSSLSKDQIAKINQAGVN
jgi:hypothetical protein